MKAEDQNVEIPEVMPMLPVRDFVVFPYMILPLYVGREASIKAIEEALSRNKMIFLASQKEIAEENPSPNSIFKVGTAAMIMRLRKLADGRLKVLIQCLEKCEITEYTKSEPYFEVKVAKIQETEHDGHLEVEAVVRNIKEQLEKLIAHGKMISPDILLSIEEAKGPGYIADFVASNLDLKVHDAQKILETLDPVARLKMVSDYLEKELELLAMQVKIRNTAKDEMTKSQKEYFLREQLRAIKSELGENDSKAEEIEELREKLLAAGMPTDVEGEVMKQLGRLERMHPDASEASMLRTYLDWMVELPWSKHTSDNLDLKHARAILDEDHFDIAKVKERILEFLAVRQLRKDMRGPILCFAGPPGVGKTSLGKSIAKAMGREYFRISLGGVKDEAEIRGHRRTYVGAMPGKVVQALKAVKTNNPVFVLDEVDKLGSDFRGDPSAALLEVLDPEQNSTFRDHYLNVDFDLSNVMFIATANVLDQIPPPLRDRMEIIQLSGYTEQEKLLISKKHLIKRQLEANGITEKNVDFTDEGLSAIISNYTRESGLRNLEREIGSVCRKVATQVVMGDKETKHVINSDKVTDMLGPARFMREESESEDRVGVVTGLAWTSVGGEVLMIETVKMRGKGGVKLTGQLGDVMKESAQAALSYARAHAEDLGIDEEWFDENEVHIHVPNGATPKDGPSAGITIATAIVSLITETPVRWDVAMTGEITLTGRVLPIGGLKEKALAALRQGCRDVVIPHQNVKDLADIPQEFREKLNFIPVKHLDEVLDVAFAKTKGRSGKKNSGPSSKGERRPKIASAAV
ncbi:MAG: endopeptidase La [Bdellovibrionales bacterium]|nr:endopeptidase La [Bdellovibrionales bacterium]